MKLAAVRRGMLGGLGAVLSLALAGPVVAQQVQAAGASEVLLRNGQWTWIEEPSFQRTIGSNTISMLISIPAQMAYVYRDGVLIAASTISTGKRGKATPTGEFPILQKRVHHRSNIYSNAPMPFMQRLTWDGIALHAGELPGFPASHGCIRFPREFARRLFETTELGTPVSVVGYEIEDPRVRRGAPPLISQQIAKAPELPYLRPDLTVIQSGNFDVVTASNDVLIPITAQYEGEVASDAGIVFADPNPVVQRMPRRRR